MNQRLRMGVSAGGPTIITIFVVLSLTTLGTLALTTAQADLRLTEKTAGYEAAYYAADSQGEDFLATVDEILAGQQEDQTGGQQTVQVAAQALEALPETEVQIQPDGSMLLNHRIPLNDIQLLLIQLQIPGDADARITAKAPYRVLTWSIKNTTYWNYEEYQVTIDGAMPE